MHLPGYVLPVMRCNSIGCNSCPYSMLTAHQATLWHATARKWMLRTLHDLRASPPFMALSAQLLSSLRGALQVVKGIVEGCRQSDCILLGGEVSSFVAETVC